MRSVLAWARDLRSRPGPSSLRWRFEVRPTTTTQVHSDSFKALESFFRVREFLTAVTTVPIHATSAGCAAITLVARGSSAQNAAYAARSSATSMMRSRVPVLIDWTRPGFKYSL